MAKGVDGRDIFLDDRDRRAFLDVMERVKKQTNAEVFAYCLMGNHFHLCVKVAHVCLAAIMQRILTSYAITFNKWHGRAGHLFQARYKPIICLDDAYMTAIIRYIHLNPVRAGITQRPEDWPWSSYNEFNKSGSDGLLQFEHDLPDFDPWKGETTEPSKPSLIRLISDVTPLPELGAAVSKTTGIDIGELRSGSRRRLVVAARTLLVKEAIKSGHRIQQIADWIGATVGAVAYHLRKSY